MSKKFYIGIDLGTTNSAISLSQLLPNGQLAANAIDILRVREVSSGIEGRPSFMKDRGKTLPSYVYYPINLDAFPCLVGDYAKEQYKRYPDRVAKSIKSQMGNPTVRDMAPDIPDRTPEAVSARILAMLRQAAKTAARSNDVNDVIITVPANFDTARREATMKAAETAGFNVREADGSWKPILISEPNAVLYDLSHRILKGEILPTVLDLSEKKRVIVYDIGGGTLDVTFHEIERDPENCMVLNISEVAASRFTCLAGDDFDRAIADRLYERCIEKFNRYEPTVVPRIRSREATVKRMLSVAAEQMKISMNESSAGGFFDSADDWFGDSAEEAGEEAAYEISHPIGDERIYNDTVTKREFEEMLRELMGEEYSFDDYVGYSGSQRIRRNTIVAPVLDVLEKAARYYESCGEELRVDAVVLNGGMSKLYLVKDRIKKFFGLEPITSADPDLSVANGAAVYAALRELHGVKSAGIKIKRHVQNDDLYLGLSSGANDKLIGVGAELPFVRELDGYRLQPGTNAIEIPIKRGGEIGEDPTTIACGTIAFKKPFAPFHRLKVCASFDQTGLMTIKAYLTNTAGILFESGSVELSLGEVFHKSDAGRILPPSGAKLMAANELNNLEAMHNPRAGKKGKKGKKKRIVDTDKIRAKLETVKDCGNPEDFEPLVLGYLSRECEITFRINLYKIADALFDRWSEEGRRALLDMARQDLMSQRRNLTPDDFHRYHITQLEELLTKHEG